MRIYLTILFSISLVGICSANDGPVYESLRGNSVKLLDESPIEMTTEDLTIRISNARIEYEILYLLTNTSGDSHDVRMGFPELCEEEYLADFPTMTCDLHDFTVRANDVSIPVTYRTGEEAVTPNINWHLHTIPFAPHEAKNVRITYWMLPKGSGIPKLSYVLSTASGWRNAIRRVDITVSFLDNLSVYGILGNIQPKGYHIDEEANQIRWHFEDLEPKTEDNILFEYGFTDTFGQTESMEHTDTRFCSQIDLGATEGNGDPNMIVTDYFQDWQAPFESSHMGRHYGCRARDGNPETAWREGAGGNGVGEWIMFDLAYPYRFEPTKVYTKLRVRNGVATSRDAWQKNTRVKRLRIEAVHKQSGYDEHGESFSREIPEPPQTVILADIFEEQMIILPSPIALKNGDDTVRVRLTIEDVYSGTLYSQASLSEVAFLGFNDPKGAGEIIPYEEPFVDTYRHTYAASIRALRSDGVLRGYDDGSFRPEATINRAEFTKILMSATQSQEAIKACLQEVQIPFSDTSHDAWYAPFVCLAYQQGTIRGYPDETFRPGSPINVAEAAKILSLTFDLPVSEDANAPWWKPYVLSLEKIGAIPPSAQDPVKLLTRGEMAEMIQQLRSE